MTAIEHGPHRFDTHFEHDLDDEPEPTRASVYVDIIAKDHERRPVIPAALRGIGNLKAGARRAAGRAGHVLAFHAVRAPLYVILAAFWAVVGVGRLTGGQVRWWWVSEQSTLRQGAATRDDSATWLALHREARSTRLWRGSVLGAELLAVVVVGLVLGYTAPGWVQAVTVAVVVPVLARVGRPVGKPIVSAAVVAPRFRKLTADVVLRAYYAARLGDPVKPGQEVTFGGPMARDGNGSRVTIDLPYGKGLDDAVKARGAIASGLDVAVSQVFITREPTSHRRHVLWVADVDPLALPAGRTPLLRLRPTDIWEPAPFGLDERGGRVVLSLLWNSVMIGAIPRQGKTFSARALALYAALDPYVKLTVFDGKGSPDWRKFALVADRCGFGLAMTRDGDPVELFLEALREIKADVQARYQRLSELPASVCPEGKLTREISRDPRYGMPVRLVVIDEFQEYFDLGDASKEIASLLVFLVKVAPAAGVIVLGATQKPSGIGTGAVAQQFTAFRDNFAVRFSLRTGSWQVSDLVLGSGAYSEGYDSSTLLPAYKGVGILRGATDATPTVRTYLADQEDAERILTAARTLRERAGTLSGQAAGEPAARQARDVLADVVKVWSHVDRAGIQWPALAELLAAHLPEGYAGATAESVSALLRAEGVASVDIKAAGTVLKGARLADVEAAIHRRQLTTG
ncbi:cell division protein FtsK [Dactylosporangium sp. NPDC049525]|uniref:cell division protein FtsK n=1 Tax=Dactylosporangium sp. NPDC049525 TaxID=3154730 RepID=UPI00344244D3